MFKDVNEVTKNQRMVTQIFSVHIFYEINCFTKELIFILCMWRLNSIKVIYQIVFVLCSNMQKVAKPYAQYL